MEQGDFRLALEESPQPTLYVHVEAVVTGQICMCRGSRDKLGKSNGAVDCFLGCCCKHPIVLVCARACIHARPEEIAINGLY